MKIKMTFSLYQSWEEDKIKRSGGGNVKYDQWTQVYYVMNVIGSLEIPEFMLGTCEFYEDKEMKFTEIKWGCKNGEPTIQCKARFRPGYVLYYDPAIRFFEERNWVITRKEYHTYKQDNCPNRDLSSGW